MASRSLCSFKLLTAALVLNFASSSGGVPVYPHDTLPSSYSPKAMDDAWNRFQKQNEGLSLAAIEGEGPGDHWQTQNTKDGNTQGPSMREVLSNKPSPKRDDKLFEIGQSLGSEVLASSSNQPSQFENHIGRRIDALDDKFNFHVVVEKSHEQALPARNLKDKYQRGGEPNSEEHEKVLNTRSMKPNFAHDAGYEFDQFNIKTSNDLTAEPLMPTATPLPDYRATTITLLI